jgi:predicted dehydrogenase
LEWGIPVLIEKPVTTSAHLAERLLELGGVAMVAHTRLYSPAWREFKAGLPKVETVEALAGGTDKDPWWDWGPHLVAMSFDLDFSQPKVHVTKEPQPLRFVVNGEHTFTDVETDPTPMEVMLGEFLRAIETGKTDGSLELGARVVQYLESHEPC